MYGHSLCLVEQAFMRQEVYSSFHIDRPFRPWLVYAVVWFYSDRLVCQARSSRYVRTQEKVWVWHCESAVCDLLSPLLAMRQHISVELKTVTLCLALVKEYKYKKIWKITGISKRSTWRLCALYQHTGDVV